MSSDRPVPSTAKRNIEAIALLEQQLLARRSTAECLGSGIAQFFGSLRFILAQLILLAAWIVANSGKIVGLPPLSVTDDPVQAVKERY